MGTKVCCISLENVPKYVFFNKKGFMFYLLNFFLFWHVNSTCLLSVTGEQKLLWQWHKDTLHFQWKSIIYSIFKRFLVQAYSFFFISRLLQCYLLLALDKMQSRTYTDPLKPNHYVYDSFFLYILSVWAIPWKFHNKIQIPLK